MEQAPGAKAQEQAEKKVHANPNREKRKGNNKCHYMVAKLTNPVLRNTRAKRS